VTASDTEAAPKTASATVTITVSPGGPTIVTTALPSGTSGDEYSATVAATGGTGAYTWSASGLPAGLTIGAATGTISGALVDVSDDDIADAPGTDQVTVTVKDASASVSKVFSLVVVQPPPAIELSALPGGTSGVAYSYGFNVAYGTAPYTWSVSGLPAGLSVSPLSGAVVSISGTPPAVTVATTYSVTVRVTDGTGTTASKTVSLVISPAAGSGL
jgi:hypothetical protein